MPAHDGLRSDNGYGVNNARTATIEPNEQGTAGPVEMHPAWRALLQDIELMPQDQDFSFEPLARLEAVAQHADEKKGRLDPLWNELFPAEQARIVQLLVERVDVSLDGADIRLRTEGLTKLAEDLRAIKPESRRAA